MDNKILNVVGKTTDGKKVVKGMFEFFDRLGFPTDSFCLECKERNMIPDWLDFYKKALSAGWSMKRIISHIEYGASMYGEEFAKIVIKKIKTFGE